MDYGTSRFRLIDRRPSLKLVRDGTAVVCIEHVVQVHVLDEGSEVSTGEVVAAAVGDGILLTVAVGDPCTVRVHALPDLAVLRTVQAPEPVHGLVMVPDGSVIALSHGGVHHLDGQQTRTVTTSDPPRVVALDPAGARLAVGLDAGKSGPVYIVDVETWTASGPLKGLRAPCTGLAWTPDRQHLVGAAGKVVVAWPAAGGKARTLYKAKQWGLLVGVSDSGLAVVSDIRKAIVAIDPASASEVWRRNAYGPCVLRTDRVIATQFEEIAEVDASTGTCLRSVTAPDIHLQAVDAHGDRVVTVQSTAQRLQVGSWQGFPEVLPGPSSAVTSVAFRDGRFLTGHRAGEVFLWQVGEPAPVRSYAVPSTYSHAAGAVVLDLGDDSVWAGVGAQVHHWRLSTGEHLGASQHLKSDVSALVRLGDGRLFAAAEAYRRRYGELVLLDPDLRILARERSDRSWTRAGVQPDGTVRLVGARWQTRVDPDDLAAATHRDARTPDYSRKACVTPDFTRMAEVRDGPLVVGGPYRGLLFTTDLAAPASLVDGLEIEPTRGSPALDDAGEVLATCHQDGVRVWDVATGEAIALLLMDDVRGARWLPGHTLLAWADDGRLRSFTVSS